MSGTVEGGFKAKETLLARNPNHFKEIGAAGGRVAKRENRTFYKQRDLARRVGRIGGQISKRTKSN